MRDCKTCQYYKKLAGSNMGSIKACHFLLEKGKARKKDGEDCLSYAPKK